MKSISKTDPLIERYLRQLKATARRLPSRERRELVADIEAHLAVATQQSEGTEASIRDLLDELGTPDEIVASAQPVGATTKLGSRETWALILLALGGLVVPVVGWVAGLVLLWSSPAWSMSKKWLATLVWPGGIGLPLVAGGFLLSVSPFGALRLALLFVALVLPLLVVFYLARTARPITGR